MNFNKIVNHKQKIHKTMSDLNDDILGLSNQPLD